MPTLPLTLQDLEAPAGREFIGSATLLARLRWHLCTPYAVAFKSVHGDNLTTGLGMAIAHQGSGWLGQRLMLPGHQGREQEGGLLDALIAALHARGCTTISAVVDEASTPLFTARGFAHEGNYLCHAGGQCEHPSLSEVELCAPRHSLGMLHLDRSASGEDRRALVSEHFYFSRIYMERGHVRGCYMPLLGDGHILAHRPDVGAELLRWHLPHVAHVWVPEANPAAREFLELRGYSVQARRMRMRLGPALPWQPAMEYAWAGEGMG